MNKKSFGIVVIALCILSNNVFAACRRLAGCGVNAVGKVAAAKKQYPSLHEAVAQMRYQECVKAEKMRQEIAEKEAHELRELNTRFIDRVNTWVADSGNVNALSPINGQTLLHEAARLGLGDACKNLIERGADPTRCDAAGCRPVDYAQLVNPSLADYLRKKVAIVPVAKSPSYPVMVFEEELADC